MKYHRRLAYSLPNTTATRADQAIMRSFNPKSHRNGKEDRIFE